MEPRRTRRPIALALLPLALAPLALAACGSESGSVSGSGAASADARLRTAGGTVEADMAHYLSNVAQCQKEANPVVCVEAADRALGGQVHSYANVLAVGHGFSAPAADLTAARNTAQTLANSLEILGDAQPTEANYDQVRNTFDVNGAIAALQRAVAKVDGSLGG
ncbi:MAG TPA: hypothetical protein VEH82_06850 [Acidimicrobiales bacterium]|nr:hypothetical protein [Acidimicrobiales bacterium]